MNFDFIAEKAEVTGSIGKITGDINMAEQVRVVVDAMGGDNAPVEPVKAAVEAVTERQDIKVILTGKQEIIEKELAKYSGYSKEQIEVVNAYDGIYGALHNDEQMVISSNINSLIDKIEQVVSNWSENEEKNINIITIIKYYWFQYNYSYYKY